MRESGFVAHWTCLSGYWMVRVGRGEVSREARAVIAVWLPGVSGGANEGRGVPGLMRGMLGAIGLCGIPRCRTTSRVFANA
jgi:hypothetical protein